MIGRSQLIQLRAANSYLSSWRHCQRSNCAQNAPTLSCGFRPSTESQAREFPIKRLKIQWHRGERAVKVENMLGKRKRRYGFQVFSVHIFQEGAHLPYVIHQHSSKNTRVIIVLGFRIIRVAVDMKYHIHIPYPYPQMPILCKRVSSK